MSNQEHEQGKNSTMQLPLVASLRISVIYLICGALWILFSDEALNAMVPDKKMFAYFSLLKGWFYIVMTALLLYYLIYKATLRMSVAERKLQHQYTELLHNREELRSIAFKDQLTGLPNRLALYENLTFLKDASLFYVDLDDFKYVNDTLGHAFGDRLIKEVSARIAGGLHASEQLYRLGGDEWVIVTREPEIRLHVRGELLLNLFDHPFAVGEHRMHMTGSIGISRFPSHGRTLEQLLKNADIALYQAKKQGKNGFAFYEDSLSVPVQHRADTERLLRQALDKGEFELHYQPQIHLATSRVTGFEALIRWNSPELGQMSPDQFIRIAEETQLIVPIGDWVLRTACEFIRTVHQKGDNAAIVSVNVSVMQLIDNRFVERVLELLNETGLEPHYLELEVTESMVIESLDLIGDKLDRLIEYGVNIALDDFGRGFSSLSHLLKLPITTLKIDKSFIEQIPDNQEDQPLTGLIIRLAKDMGIKVVAEGVEKYVQLDYLKKYECDCIQGYLFSEPLPAIIARDWIKTASLPTLCF
ncbi:putative bifunctional diguanylate cyclase/phosphodiesterase [Cohnella silvisoli]|uniref:Bifunctional diguanylate cyclase/phosphodiesterase n=1 Tax=Cohnella silvisoli TaxID=2873699 RepID=A0ABV1L0J6_9BACL|nr:bifunctional diguanylate cyclase/phosphodiesterase [Cohnella silvisoli]MCD9024992.1 bifunctional diguanylate cyclase/phosphodiesterase [Cohnella silvisoli]